MIHPFPLDPVGGRPLGALVTGGASGLGLALAHELADRGCSVLICARTRGDLETATADDSRLRAIRADITQMEDRERLLAEGERLFGHPLDILVNNAAIVRAHDYMNHHSLAADRAMPEIATNLIAPIDLARLFLRSRYNRTDNAAAILNVSSPGAFFPLDANPLYTATKAAFHMFTLSLRRHLSGGPVRVFEVFPPSLDTRLANQLEVESQAANGQDVINAVARETIEALIAGQEMIVPHDDSRKLVAMFPTFDEDMLNAINQGVRRRPGWDKE
jgi:uncharacterized oxidoreductase